MSHAMESSFPKDGIVIGVDGLSAKVGSVTRGNLSLRWWEGRNCSKQ